MSRLQAVGLCAPAPLSVVRRGGLETLVFRRSVSWRSFRTSSIRWCQPQCAFSITLFRGAGAEAVAGSFIMLGFAVMRCRGRASDVSSLQWGRRQPSGLPHRQPCPPPRGFLRTARSRNQPSKRYAALLGQRGEIAAHGTARIVILPSPLVILPPVPARHLPSTVDSVSRAGDLIRVAVDTVDHHLRLLLTEALFPECFQQMRGKAA